MRHKSKRQFIALSFLAKLYVSRRKLLETRRSKAEFDAARKEYDIARAKFLLVIDSWGAAEHLQLNGELHCSSIILH
jgi:hypothetical protein